MTALQIDVMRICLQKMRPTLLLRSRCIDIQSPVAMAMSKRRQKRDRSAYRDIDTSPNESGDTALLNATDYGLTKHVEKLLAHGADASVQDQQGRSAMDIAGEHGFMWAIYGGSTNNIFPVLVCTITDRAAIHKIWARAACVLAAGTLYLILGSCGATGQTFDQVASTFGFIAVAINIALYASPLANMKKVIETKDASSLPITISAVFLGNAALWVLYSITVGDMFVMVPNLLGMLLCTARTRED
ncbi:hypothetical protein PHYSODRAFT_324669 [Phytophthora sojae]|uniref:Sugar transporter SWEET1 n=1 Tax=Phytophthora sojae (strain P6497) TaxID=1094619 RepID=G4YRJ1_PHYSP|nr:hypothetical protein PHYSODRAFT_324669 [Phytophthora sojae]EGZ23456.1 hypothetical protein PHYSODRAFT_324669 [Phytophthora sojae]|eukprot:XP_009518744.1 hypothetical protein PHYSODRAFT_324669 [Phytophthora sojae]